MAIFCLRDRVEGECLSHLLTDETYEPLHPVTVVRWLEWGVRSYHTFMLGVSLFLFAGLIVAGIVLVFIWSVCLLWTAWREH